MMSLGLAATGGILGALLLTVDGEKAGNLENIWARASAPAPCTPAELPEGTVAYPAVADAETSCAAEWREPESAIERRAITAPAAAPGGAIPAAVTKPPRRPSPTPTYIRKPQPAPEPEHLALEALRGGI